MGSKSPGNTSQPPAFFSKLTESNSAMVKSKKQEINKKLNTHNRNEPEYSKGLPAPPEAGARWEPLGSRNPQDAFQSQVELLTPLPLAHHPMLKVCQAASFLLWALAGTEHGTCSGAQHIVGTQ